MNRWIRAAAAGLVLAAAACGDSSSGSPVAPDAPRFDSGPIVSGNSTAPDSTDYTKSGPIVTGN